ncbi:kinetochore protein Nuf2-like [Haliotis rubra]|uniref:kinetochore protein Nuf2-like n=1 Tax=Haliotis rubra TaxID=36100 RepID=UPI001EE5DEBD|nr:kinetochore protein Nuf2-like [Haliotis rubra]
MSLSHQFPTLTVDQIVTVCREMEIPITENDMRKPDVHRWNSLYGMVLESLAGITADQVRQQHIHSSQLCDNPEIHEESMSLMAFTLAIQRVMYACAFTDFSVKDVIDPRPKRLIKIMSAAINFYRFRQSRIEMFDELKAKNERYREQREYLLKSNDELKQKISKLKAIRAEQEPEIKKVMEEIEVMGRQVSENHKIQSATQKTVAEVRKNIAEKKAAQDQLKLAILTSQQEGEKLSQKIVQSPERVKQEQERMEQKLAGLKMTLDEKRTRGATLRAEHKKVKELEACALKALKLLQSIKQDVDKENEVVEQMSGCGDQHQEQQQTLGELTAKQDQLKHVQAIRQEKRTKQHMQHQAKMKAYTEQLNQLNELVKSHSEDQDEELKRLQQSKHQVLCELKEQEKATGTRVENIHKLYSQIVDLVDVMHADLGCDWDSFRQLLKAELDTLC